VLALSACVASDGSESFDVSGSPAPDAHESAPAVGSLSTAQQYLQRHGYLRPDTPEPDGAPPVYVDDAFEHGTLDGPTQRALRHFQAFVGIPASGELDATTLETMNKPRCGVTDVPFPAPALDAPIDKFAVQAQLTRGSAWIRVRRYPDGASDGTRAAIDSDIESAALDVRRKTGFSVLRTTSTSTPPSGTWAIDVYFYTGDRPSGVNTLCPSPMPSNYGAAVVSNVSPSTGLQSGPIPLCVNSGQNYQYGAGSDSRLDFQAVLTHELGHATGLGHSSIPGALMRPIMNAGDPDASFKVDDLQAEWSRWGRFAENANSPSVREITWGGGNTLYAIDTTPHPDGNFGIWRRSGATRGWDQSVVATWTKLDGYGTRVMYDGFRLWHLNAQGMIYYRNDADTGWTQLPGCARDIAGNDAESWWWAVGCDGALYYAFRGDPEFTYYTRPENGAVRITYDRRRNNLWFVDGANVVYRGIFGFTRVGSGIKDIDVGQDGTVWAVTTANKAAILSWQAEIPNPAKPNEPFAPRKEEFVPFIGNARGMTGDPSGFPAIINDWNRVSDIRLFYTN
jgi:hypothetical protein